MSAQLGKQNRAASGQQQSIKPRQSQQSRLVGAVYPATDSTGQTIWIADAHRGDGKRFVVRAGEKLTAFGSPLVARSSNILISKEAVRIPS